ncbi:ribonuclease T [Kaistia sp. 32K]|uniref:ribonuclease T2 family protein n=1 Tax=Kaistia sp. 32K TaxID=2795690 RepID=UPI001914F709
MAALWTSQTAASADTPGEFDFYVLSLSWSPTYCQDRGTSDRIQCGGPRPFAFVVHGLWPQYERGSPRNCDVGPRSGLPRRLVDGMLDIMPSPGLVRHEWRTHGSCSGLEPADYFALTRQANQAVRIPERFVDVETYLTVSPDEVEAAFIAANPGLRRDGIAVSCDSRRLKEVRICLTRDLRFRSCAEVDRKACRNDRLTMPPVR